MHQKITIYSEDDIYIAVSVGRKLTKELGFSAIEEQKVCVSVLELTRNILIHGGGKGYVLFGYLEPNGIQIEVTDFGPGLDHNLSEELSNQQYGSQGLGLGLSGARRLMDNLNINSSKEGTQIIATKWKGGIRQPQ